MTSVSIDIQVERALDFMLQQPPADQATEPRTVYLMRGLPSAGKSFRARELAGEHGVVCETDSFLQERGGTAASMEVARKANFESFIHYIEQGKTPIVVDRGNGLNAETYVYVNAARQYGYEIELEEPKSPWWQEIKTLLRYRPHTDPILNSWAHELARLNAETHQVSAETILDWLDGWVADLTTDELLEQAERFAQNSSS